jgi:hypothetical protein
VRSGTIGLILLMVCVIVAVDFAFFRDNFRGRLIANIMIVLVFGVTYVLVTRH